MFPTNLPTQKLEAWRFTPLARLLADLPEAVGDAPLPELPTFPEPTLVLVNGQPQTMALPAGCTLEAIANLDAPVLDTLDDLPAPAFRLTLAPGTTLQLLHVATAPLATSQLEVNVPSGEASLIEYHIAHPTYAGWAAHRAHVRLAASSVLKTSRFVQLPKGVVATARIHLHLPAQANLQVATLQTGAALGRLEHHVVAEQSSSYSQTGLHLTRGNQLESLFTSRLTGPHPTLQVRQKNLVDGGHCVFQGKFHVEAEAQRTDAYMHCNSLLMNESSLASHKPELEIYADDVKCSHGAAIGKLDDNQLFYLQARGLTPAAAQRLLLAGYVAELAPAFPPAAQGIFEAITNAWLHNPEAG